jgi:uncharacterized UPF0146 family protein
LHEFTAIAEYIAEKYPSAKKIVEVGVGKVPDVAIALERVLPNCEIIVTDVVEGTGLSGRVKFVRDDITEPNLGIYEGAMLIYSVRPPPELQPYLHRVARKVGADLLIKPLTGESMSLRGGKLINYHGVAFYVNFNPQNPII